MGKTPPLTTAPRLETHNVSAQWFWYGVALFGHTGWGAYPVLARYLQTVSNLPSMSILALGNAVALLAFAPFMHGRVDLRLFRSPMIGVFAFVVALRSVTNLLAARYTLAIYVQLITLMTPLVVAVLGKTFFRETLPRGTVWAIGLSFVGALLMMSKDIGASGFGFALGPTDLLGIALALVSSICLALYMLIVPRTVKNQVSGESLFVIQLIVLIVTSSVISALLGEDWRRWQVAGLADWGVFLLFALAVFLGANVSQISSLRHLGATLVSSLLSWRLLSTLVIAALVLGERLSSLWQIVGAVLVLATITAYLWQQRGVTR